MLLEYAKTFKDKKVGFIGLGVSNTPILRLLLQAGAVCSVRDMKALPPEEAEALTREGVAIHCGETYLEGIDEEFLFLSPAVRSDLPKLEEAKERGTVLTNEMEEFFRLCPCPIIAVTGSDGKTTTTTLIAKLLEAEGKTVHLGGNIGRNLLCELDAMTKDHFAVVELSSFQLMKMTRSPMIAVVTNISPNHLNWHVDMEEYVSAKESIFLFQQAENKLIVNKDDSYAARCASKAKGKVKFTSGKEKADVWFDERGIYRGETLVVKDTEIRLVGIHNRYNYAQAICATEGLVSDEAIRKVARDFGGVEHRCEFVREKDGVKYYNSSIDSSPTRTAACVNSFKVPLVVICGGYDKNIPLEPLGELFPGRVKHAVLCGATSEKIQKVLDAVGYTAYTRVSDFEEAVKTASSLAEAGDCVVLSPAAASFDMFKNFAVRGETFKKLVQEL
ncbi:MAG: UDP-N-acetylmuramoyl-L-alanine--D-glutamate ligase [Clostridia bacterium]|nr:UDP-N-acetylmuramoyl-L-alanine--D-glutamate ligase [Clostridia bacterium]